MPNYYGDEFIPRDNATLEYFRTCNRTDQEFWNITILRKENTGRSHEIINHIKCMPIFYILISKPYLSVSYIDYTDLRKGTVYYNIYCIWINFVFASFIPFTLLLYFNISIAKKLNSRAKKETKLRRTNRLVYWYKFLLLPLLIWFWKSF